MQQSSDSTSTYQLTPQEAQLIDYLRTHDVDGFLESDIVMELQEAAHRTMMDLAVSFYLSGIRAGMPAWVELLQKVK